MDELRKVLAIEGNESTVNAVEMAYRNGGSKAVQLGIPDEIEAQSNKGICLTGSLPKLLRSRTREEAFSTERAFRSGMHSSCIFSTTRPLIPCIRSALLGHREEDGMPPLQ